MKTSYGLLRSSPPAAYCCWCYALNGVLTATGRTKRACRDGCGGGFAGRFGLRCGRLPCSATPVAGTVRNRRGDGALLHTGGGTTDCANRVRRDVSARWRGMVACWLRLPAACATPRYPPFVTPLDLRTRRLSGTPFERRPCCSLVCLCTVLASGCRGTRPSCPSLVRVARSAPYSSYGERRRWDGIWFAP
jgi:hypothetical protein